jgi:putative CocE/NonD family hydrolase
LPGWLSLLATAAGVAEAQRPVSRFPWPAPRYTGQRVERNLFVPMRDGVKLATDLYFPEGAPGPLPTILLRTPYGKTGGAGAALRFVGQGYAVASQDVRGKYESEGEFWPTGADKNDGYDTIEWIVRQPWSSGKVGTIGCSYLGETQLTAASARHPAHAAMVPQAGSNVMELAGVFKGGTTRGGAIELSSSADWLRTHGSKVRPVLLPNDDRAAFNRARATFTLQPRPPATDFIAMLRSLPLVGMLERMGAPPSDWDELVSSEPQSGVGKRIGFLQPDDRFDTPALFVDSWYDYGPANTLRLFRLLREQGLSERTRRNVFAVIGPTTHCAYERAAEHTVVGRRDVGDARFEFGGLYLRWFDRWLKGEENGVTDSPPLQLYVMGRNEWRGEAEWPLARTVWTRYYLHSDGRANSRFGSGLLTTTTPGNQPADAYTYDPATPVPSAGGPDFGANNPDLPPGALDQTSLETRHDVLVYSTPPLERGVEVTGPIALKLFVSSDARDTDFTAKLVDVYPDGRAFNVQEGILRMRYREGFDRRVWMQPGQAYEIEIDLEVTSNYFAPGHRIRLEVSSSNFPRFDRNLNTGGNNWDETTWRIARNTVHHSARYPSHLLLPVIPER